MWMEGHSSSLLTRDHPPAACDVGLSSMASCFIKARESSRKSEVTVLGSQVMGATAHQHFRNPLVTSMSQTVPTHRVREFHKKWEYGETGIIRAI